MLEALVFASDTLNLSFVEIRDITAGYGKDISLLTLSDRIKLFRNAWAIIDNLHSFRMLMNGLYGSKLGTKQQEFYSKSESARKIRNRMDHPLGTIPNRANQTNGNQSAYFGTISYVYLDPEHFVSRPENLTTIDVRMVNIFSGSVLSNMLNTNPIDIFGRNIYGPVNRFSFGAFNEVISLDDLTASANEIINHLSHHMERELNLKVEALAQKNGNDKKIYLQPEPMKDVVMIIDLSFPQCGSAMF